MNRKPFHVMFTPGLVEGEEGVTLAFDRPREAEWVIVFLSELDDACPAREQAQVRPDRTAERIGDVEGPAAPAGGGDQRVERPLPAVGHRDQAGLDPRRRQPHPRRDRPCRRGGRHRALERGGGDDDGP